MTTLALDLDAEISALDLAIAVVLQKSRRDVIRKKKSKKKTQKIRSIWTREWLLERPLMGQYRLIAEKLRFKDLKAFKTAVRMDPEMFFAVLGRLRHRIQKQDTWWREAIDPGTRLALTLKFYSTGEPYMSMCLAWYIAPNTISKIIKEVSEAIVAEFSEELMTPPVTAVNWKKVADHFSDRWNFHHCLGALDGKHVALRMPKKSGSIFFNFKHFYSIVLLALVDANYKFLWVDVGTNGACSDAQIWNACQLKEHAEDNKLNLPKPEPIVAGEMDIPYFFVGDDAFALRTFMMKPHSKRNLTRPERIFNYRLSRARRIVENAFGILANRFGCLLNTMKLVPETATSVVLACCCLHNILRDANPEYLSQVDREEEVNHDLILGEWRDGGEMEDGDTIGGNNTSSKKGKAVRDYLTQYYNSEVGSVPWQDKQVPL